MNKAQVEHAAKILKTGNMSVQSYTVTEVTRSEDGQSRDHVDLGKFTTCAEAFAVAKPLQAKNGLRDIRVYRVDEKWDGSDNYERVL